MKRRVVVTGLGVVTSLGRSVGTFWERLLRGESGVGPITLFDVSGFRVQFAGEVPWNPEEANIANPKELRRLDRFTQFAMAAAADAVTDSGLDFSREEPFRCGVVIGSGIGGLAEFEAQHERLLTKGIDKVSPFTIPKLMVNSGSGHVSSMYGIKGPNFSVATACASAAHSIGESLRCVQYGDADIMIAGGSEAALTPMGLAGFQNMRALSFRSEAPARASYGASGDAGHITQPDEEGRGAARAMAMALADAGLPADRVQYVNAHGTSTPLGDKAETVAIKRVFGEHARRLSVSSTKSQLGHTLGASGGIELVACALSIDRGVIAPTINLENPDPECDLDYTPNVARERSVGVAMSNSFGFGGHNASLVLARLD